MTDFEKKIYTPKIPSFLEAKSKLEFWCAYQERCQFEVDAKLNTWNFSYEERDQLISHLISNNFINEERFAEAFVSGKFRIKHWGRNKIKQHLKQKRISDYSIRKGMKEIDPDEYWETLLHLTERKLNEKKTGEDIWQRQARTQRYLSAKGYEFDLIVESIKSIQNKG
jgi:regulatory protein